MTPIRREIGTSQQFVVRERQRSALVGSVRSNQVPVHIFLNFNVEPIVHWLLMEFTAHEFVGY